MRSLLLRVDGSDVAGNISTGRVAAWCTADGWYDGFICGNSVMTG